MQSILEKSQEIILQSLKCIKQRMGKWENTKPIMKKIPNIKYIINILILLYVNDAAVPFENRNNMIKGLEIIDRIVSKFSFLIHKGAGEKNQKRKHFFWCNETIKNWKKRK